MFELHPRLARDTAPLVRLALSDLRLMNDQTYPWVILVPARKDIRELHELDVRDRATLIEEISVVSRAMVEAFAPDKINVAALGNVVSQLHIHVVARFASDPAWPGPVWGLAPPAPYSPEAAVAVIAKLVRVLPASSSGGLS